MKLNSNRSLNAESNDSPFTSFCLEYCRKLITEIQKTKRQFVGQFRKVFAGQEQLLRLALNEAEALAFLTDYPHLVFPSLAMEKVQGAAQWQSQQKSIGRPPATFGRF